MVCYYIGVYINGINRVSDSDGVIFVENIEDIVGVIFRIVGDENFFGVNFIVFSLEIVLGNFFL